MDQMSCVIRAKVRIRTNRIKLIKYITDKHIKVPYTITIEVIDNVFPIVDYPGTKVITVGTTKKELENSFFCGDNYDNHPKCRIVGEYSLKDPVKWENQRKKITNEYVTGKITIKEYTLKAHQLIENVL